MRPLRTGLLVTAACSAVVGAVFSLLPTAFGTPAGRAPEARAPFTPPALVPADPALAEDVVLANVFSARRSPPTSRYAPPDAMMDTSGGVVADPVEVPGEDAAPTGAPLLLGTVVGPTGTQALLQLDPYAGSPRLYSVGDRDGGYRVIAISPRSVIMAGPRGRVTVRLESQEERP